MTESLSPLDAYLSALLSYSNYFSSDSEVLSANISSSDI